jgi:hypothetical protein
MADGPNIGNPGEPTHRVISIAEMIDACRAEAHRIQSTQRALVESALALKADPEQVRRADVFDHVALLLERVEPYLAEIKRIHNSRRFGR